MNIDERRCYECDSPDSTFTCDFYDEDGNFTGKEYICEDCASDYDSEDLEELE